TDDAPRWAAEHRDALRAAVVQHGSLLVRGLGLRDVAGTEAVFRRLGSLMTEREAFAPRRRYSDGVYTSSKWPPNQHMCMHHELSYTLEFPSLMLFACLIAPADGGETPVADSAAVLHALPSELVERFERVGWLLIRNYNDEIWGRRSLKLSAPTTVAPSRVTAVRTQSSSSGNPTEPCAPGSSAAPSCITRSPGSSAGSTKSHSSTSGRWTRRCASTSWTSTARTGCRSILALATATRSART